MIVKIARGDRSEKGSRPGGPIGSQWRVRSGARGGAARPGLRQFDGRMVRIDEYRPGRAPAPPSRIRPELGRGADRPRSTGSSPTFWVLRSPGCTGSLRRLRLADRRQRDFLTWSGYLAPRIPRIAGRARAAGSFPPDRPAALFRRVTEVARRVSRWS